MASKQRITQATLAAILRKRKKIADAQADLDELETALTADLKAGYEVAPGILAARVKEWERRNVAWKEIVVREKGQEYTDRVLAATRPETYAKLVVEAAK